jgi:hypothetical protein
MNKENMMNEFPKVKAHWSEVPDSIPGWFAVEYDRNDEVVSDSQKVSFPVDLDGIERSDRQTVINLLADAFPDHEIYVA